MDRLSGDRFVPERKVTDYLLNPSHPTGAAKARFSAQFGFSAADPIALVEAISSHPNANRIVRIEESEFGTKSVVECSVTTPDGRNPCIRTVWMRDIGRPPFRDRLSRGLAFRTEELTPSAAP